MEEVSRSVGSRVLDLSTTLRVYKGDEAALLLDVVHKLVGCQAITNIPIESSPATSPSTPISASLNSVSIAPPPQKNAVVGRRFRVWCRFHFSTSFPEEGSERMRKSANA